MIKMGFEFEHGSPLSFPGLNRSFKAKFPEKKLGEYGSFGIPEHYSFHDDYSVFEDSCRSTAELVTPPLPFEQAVDDCLTILSWMTENKALTDRSSGFHVGMSFMDNELQNKIKNSKYLFSKLLFGIPEVEILKSFGRDTNQYSRSLKNIIKSLYSNYNGSPLDRTEAILERFSGHGWYSITLEKLKERNSYVEFRMLGGPNYNNRTDEIVNVLNCYKDSYEKLLDDSDEYKEIITDRIKAFLVS